MSHPNTSPLMELAQRENYTIFALRGMIGIIRRMKHLNVLGPITLTNIECSLCAAINEVKLSQLNRNTHRRQRSRK